MIFIYRYTKHRISRYNTRYEIKSSLNKINKVKTMLLKCSHSIIPNQLNL